MTAKAAYHFTPGELLEAWTSGGRTNRGAAVQLGIGDMTFARHFKAAFPGGEPDCGLDIRPLPETDEPIEQVIQRRRQQFDIKRQYEKAAKLAAVGVRIKGPIGLLAFGDPHVDDDGTDIAALERHAHLVRDTEGLYAGNVGDTTNNWVGRLARLYAEQETSAKTAWRLAEWFIRLCPRNKAEWTDRPKWLFIVGGNHDCWSGESDPLKWITRQANSIYSKSQVRLNLSFPNGTEVRVNCAHDFRGASQWNPAHGSMKASQLGFRDHILLNGHRHTSGYGLIKDPMTGLISHCIQVASYKVYDRYAQELGLVDRHISPSVLCVIDPEAAEVGRVTVFFDVDAGVDFLRWKRERKGKPGRR